MKNQFKFFFLLSLFFIIKQTSFSQGVIVADVHGIIGDGHQYCRNYTSTVEKQGSSVFIPNPSCSEGEENSYRISIKSSCSIPSGCDDLSLTYDCDSKVWKVSYLPNYPIVKKCDGITPSDPENTTNILWRKDPNSEQTFWKLNAFAFPSGLKLIDISPYPCTSTITVTGGTYTKSIAPCNSGSSIGNANSRIQSHPNPTTGFLDLQFEGVKEGTANIQVYNNIGTLVQEIPSVSVYQGKNNTEMDLSNLPAGLYNIIIRQGETAVTQRIQKL